MFFLNIVNEGEIHGYEQIFGIETELNYYYRVLISYTGVTKIYIGVVDLGWRGAVKELGRVETTFF